MLAKYRNRIVFILVLIACTTLVTIQYFQNKYEHERLQNLGRRTQIVASRSFRYGTDCVDYYFVTSNGIRVEGSQKCPDGCSKYTNATIIYNPNDPCEFQFVFDFERYDPDYLIVFFFVFYLPLMTGCTYGMIQGIPRLFSALRNFNDKRLAK